MRNQNLSKQIAADLLQIKAVFLRPAEPFTWASGILSPVYCDNRLTLSYPKVRRRIAEGFAEVLHENHPGCEVLMGTSTSGIPHAAILSDILGLPMGYVRGGTKSHGRNRQIEGNLEPGQKVVVIEDLISTAGSAIEVVEILREAGAEVLGILSIFTYNMQTGTKKLAEAKIENISLTDFDTLIALAADTGYIPATARAALLAFRDHPDDSGWQNLLA
jgi:orotate phosphoribosyltransferase